MVKYTSVQEQEKSEIKVIPVLENISNYSILFAKNIIYKKSLYNTKFFYKLK